MAGDGPAADTAGNIYLLDGNGTFDAALDQSGFPVRKDYGNGFLKISTTSGLAVADFVAGAEPVVAVGAGAGDVEQDKGGLGVKSSARRSPPPRRPRPPSRRRRAS